MNEMAAESFIFFSGGYETSSTALTFLLYELALNPDVQQKLREEIQNGLEENDGKINYELLLHFEYLEMVVKEGLRKYPVIPGELAVLERLLTCSYLLQECSENARKNTKSPAPIK